MPFGMSTDGNIGDTGDRDGDFLVGEFALGVLSAEEHARVAARIAADPALKAELAMWRQRLAGLDREYAEERAPLAPLLRAEARLFPQPRPTSAWNSLVVWRSLAAGGVAVAVAAIGFNLMQPATLDPRELATQLVAAIEAQEGSGVSFVALYDSATGMLRLTSLSGEPMPNRDFELWAIHGSEPPVSMGVVPMDARAEIEMPDDVPFTEGTVLAVSIEPRGGSPTDGPTGPVVAMGKATAI
jgi:anti-sigma-K factor RskA